MLKIVVLDMTLFVLISENMFEAMVVFLREKRFHCVKGLEAHIVSFRVSFIRFDRFILTVPSWRIFQYD